MPASVLIVDDDPRFRALAGRLLADCGIEVVGAAGTVADDRLLAAGRMTPAGLAAVEAAMRSGTWAALDAVEDLHEPEDLRDALDTTPGARRHWDAFPRSTKRAILEWIANAKTPATRTKRITETATKAAQNLRANQWRQPKGRTTQPLPARPPRRGQDTAETHPG